MKGNTEVFKGFRALLENLQSEIVTLIQLQNLHMLIFFYQVNYLHDAELSGLKCISHLRMSLLLSAE